MPDVTPPDPDRARRTDRLWQGVRTRGPAVAGRAARITVWSVTHFLFALGQQLAELLAPLLLVVGIGWAALPRALGLIQTPDGQMRDILNGLQTHIPGTITFDGHAVSAIGMIVAGFALMAVAALLSTLIGVLDRELYRRS